MKEFNINDYVKVKLTETGEQILKLYSINDAKGCRNPKEAMEIIAKSYNSQLDKDGYLQIQFRELMQIFGPFLSLIGDIPFESSIVRIDDKDLVDIPDESKLSEKVDGEIETLIKSSKELTEWFERNMPIIEYYGLTEEDCLKFENGNNYDLMILGRMLNACYKALGMKLDFLQSVKPDLYTDEVRVGVAISSMEEIYKEAEAHLTDTSRNKLLIRKHVYTDSSSGFGK